MNRTKFWSSNLYRQVEGTIYNICNTEKKRRKTKVVQAKLSSLLEKRQKEFNVFDLMWMHIQQCIRYIALSNCIRKRSPFNISKISACNTVLSLYLYNISIVIFLPLSYAHSLHIWKKNYIMYIIAAVIWMCKNINMK